MHRSVKHKDKLVCVKKPLFMLPTVPYICIGHTADIDTTGPYDFIVANSVRNYNHNAFSLLFMFFSIDRNRRNRYNYNA